MKPCVTKCYSKNKRCNNKSCRYWINYKEDLNCTFITIEKHGSLTLREIAVRENLSLVRIKQIQDRALVKIKKLKPIMKDFLF
jgi:hypothetical protein